MFCFYVCWTRIIKKLSDLPDVLVLYESRSSACETDKIENILTVIHYANASSNVPIIAWITDFVSSWHSSLCTHDLRIMVIGWPNFAKITRNTPNNWKLTKMFASALIGSKFVDKSCETINERTIGGLNGSVESRANADKWAFRRGGFVKNFESDARIDRYDCRETLHTGGEGFAWGNVIDLLID